MNDSLLAGRYAKALLAHADSLGQAEALYPIMGELAHVAMDSAGVAQVLKNPIVGGEEKVRVVVEALCERVACEGESRMLVERFVGLVVGHHRERWLGQMALGYVRLYRKSRGIVRVNLTTTAEPEEALVERLRTMVEERTGGVAEINTHIQPSIEGGFVLQVDDLLLDASLRGQLEKIRKELLRKNKTLV